MKINSNYVLALTGVLLCGGTTFLAAETYRDLPAKAGVLRGNTAMPSLSGAIGWLNSAPLGRKSLRGKVVLVDFWTYTCINSLRPLPYVKSWSKKYKANGLVVIGVHSPEFSFEKEQVNVQNAVRDLKIAFPVAIDSNYAIWNAFHNDYWPAQYLVDASGQIRYQHLGEGDYDVIERNIKKLLRENGASNLERGLVKVSGTGIEAAPSDDVQSPESYIGSDKAERFASPGGLIKNSAVTYQRPAELFFNQWGLGGTWNVGGESAVLQATPGSIIYRFHSRDLNLVLAPAKDGTPIRFRVTLDGTAPESSHGADTGPDGSGVVTEPRLYQLARQAGQARDRTFEIQFIDSGVRALDFTFG